MGRVQQKCVKSPTNTIRSNVCQENDEPSNQQGKKLSIRSKYADKYSAGKCSIKCQSKHLVENAKVVLEDIGINSSLVTKRCVLGDKTNRSPMSPSNQMQKKLNGSPDLKQQKKMSHLLLDRTSEERSLFKSSVSRKRLSANKSQGVVSSDGNLETGTKSLDFSDKCIYAKVQRETLRNKNMPLEEKLAQYEFEIDENEPIVKKRKKKNVKHRKKVKSKEEYYPPSKVFKKMLLAGVEQAAEKIKEKPKDACAARDLKSKIDWSDESTSRDQALGCEVQVDALSLLVPPSVRKRTLSFSENTSLVTRPDSRSETGSVRSLGSFEELEVDANENSIKSSTSCFEKSHTNLNLNVSIDSCTSRETHSSSENKCNNESGKFKSPIRLQLASSLGKTISTPIQNNVKDRRFAFTEVTSTSTPIFQSTPLNRNCLAFTNVSHSGVVSSGNHSVNVNKRAFIIPRESGGVNNQYNKVLAENWSVENCFGFEDGSEETAESPSFSDISLKQRLRNITSTFSSTPSPNERKACSLSPYFKRKRESTAAALPYKSPKPDIRIESTADSSIMDKSSARLNTSKMEHFDKEFDTSVIEKPSPVITDLPPYSNPFKQSKLEFIDIKSKTPTCQTPKQTNQESPLLFKDPEDKTPIHFKEPARRSYVRSIRRKMKPLGSEWIEIDSESEEERERSHHSAEIRKRKGKFNKQEVKEANKWMKDFNRQCEEINEFELCVEK